MKYSCHQESSVFHGWFVYLHKLGYLKDSNAAGHSVDTGIS